MKISAGEDFYDLRRREIRARNHSDRHQHGDRKTRETYGMSQRGECERERRGKSHQGRGRQQGIGPATRKSVRMHFHYALFAEILQDLAKTVASMPLSDAAHRDMLRDAAKALYRALDPARNDKADLAGMTPEEEVLLLHVME